MKCKCGDQIGIVGAALRESDMRFYEGGTCSRCGTYTEQVMPEETLPDWARAHRRLVELRQARRPGEAPGGEG